MKLPENLVKEFVKVTKDDAPKKTEYYVYGTAHVVDNHIDVIFDGATEPTPCSSSVTVEDGDRVMVMIKDRQAVITSNLSSPSINVDTLKAKDIEFSGTLRGADGSFSGTVTIDWSTEYFLNNILISLGSDSFAPFALEYVDKTYDDSTLTFFPEQIDMSKNEGRTFIQLSLEDGIQTTKVQRTQRNLGLDHGYVSVGQVNGRSYKDVHVNYHDYVAYTAAPTVVACLVTSSTASETGSCTCVVHSIDTSGFTVRVYNNNSISLAPNVEWISMGGSDY